MSPGPAPPGILHMDMDAFFVAVEVHRDPSLAGRPVVVGGTGARGVVAAASYEARAYGIHSAMPSGRARRLCPHAVFLPGRPRALPARSAPGSWPSSTRFTPLVEPLSLDEAFLDVTGARRLWGTGPEIAVKIREAVLDQEGLTCSVGVAPTKFLAKLASEAAKPVAALDGVRPGRGVVVVPVGEELRFLHPLPVRALWGVGPKTHERLDRLGIATVGDLAALPLRHARRHRRRRQPDATCTRWPTGSTTGRSSPSRASSRWATRRPSPRTTTTPPTLGRELTRLADAVGRRLRAHGLAGRTVVLKVRFGDFRTITRSVTLPDATDSGRVVARAAQGLLAEIDVSVGVRLIGVSVSSLAAGGTEQLTLDGPTDWTEADRTMDRIRDRFGVDAIAPAVSLRDDGVRAKRRGDQQWGPGE